MVVVVVVGLTLLLELINKLITVSPCTGVSGDGEMGRG